MKRNWKHLICLLTAIVLLVCLTACEKKVATEETSEAETPSQTETTSQSTTASETETTAQTEPPTEAKKEQPENTLKNFGSESSTGALFGNSSYTREWVKQIIFIDTLNSVPADAWDVSEKQNGCVMAWVDQSNGFDLYIAGEGGVYAPKNSASLFACFYELIEIHFNQCFYTECMVDMSYLFETNKSLELIDCSNFDTSNVTKMFGTFYGCRSLTSLDLSMWNVECVTDMREMFYNCFCLEEINLDGWNTKSLRDMVRIFSYCERLTYVDLSGFNTANVTHMTAMFNGCDSLTNVKLDGFDTSKVESFKSMFDGCESLETLDLSGFDFSAATKFSNMFRDTKKLTSIGCTITPPADADITDMYKDSALQP